MYKPFKYIWLIEYKINVCNGEITSFKVNHMFYSRYENINNFNKEQDKYWRRKENKDNEIIYYFYHVNFGWCLPQQFKYKNNCEIK